MGSRTLTGCLVSQTADAPDPDAVKDVVEVLDQEPFLPPRVVELCEWVAEYYLAGIGDAIAVAMPPGARARATSFKTRQVATVTAHALALSDAQDGAVRTGLRGVEGVTPKQRAALDIRSAAGRCC